MINKLRPLVLLGIPLAISAGCSNEEVEKNERNMRAVMESLHDEAYSFGISEKAFSIDEPMQTVQTFFDNGKITEEQKKYLEEAYHASYSGSPSIDHKRNFSIYHLNLSNRDSSKGEYYSTLALMLFVNRKVDGYKDFLSEEQMNRMKNPAKSPMRTDALEQILSFSQRTDRDLSFPDMEFFDSIKEYVDDGNTMDPDLVERLLSRYSNEDTQDEIKILIDYLKQGIASPEDIDAANCSLSTFTNNLFDKLKGDLDAYDLYRASQQRSYEDTVDALIYFANSSEVNIDQAMVEKIADCKNKDLKSFLVKMNHRRLAGHIADFLNTDDLNEDQAMELVLTLNEYEYKHEKDALRYLAHMMINKRADQLPDPFRMRIKLKRLDQEHELGELNDMLDNLKSRTASLY